MPQLRAYVPMVDGVGFTTESTSRSRWLAFCTNESAWDFLDTSEPDGTRSVAEYVIAPDQLLASQTGKPVSVSCGQAPLATYSDNHTRRP